ncbi:hypothetical protein CR159_03415 [Pollutimonas subterranea]|uniref:Band 7 domain-containing protein n=1 Tax=Pollutimonas subterranea TaxID=2045210 RepID=A0A2N4U8G0_9BURK|nr:prohibitin family protein [Pollutimonas subterranea]PLC51291.1 hypothetical protein CR159_03415 [Pollutimonas subterranea]
MNLKLRHKLRRLTSALVFLLLIFVFLIIVLWDSVVQTTPVGHTSVLWHRFPISDEHSVGPLREGVHLIQPWDQFYTYDLRLQTSDHDFQVVSKDGLHFNISFTIRWRLLRDKIVLLNQTLGPAYVEKLLAPKIGWAARRVVALYSAEALFTEKRSEVQDALYELITSASIENGIAPEAPGRHDPNDVLELTDVLILRVELPPQIRQAIENKLEQGQIVEEYRFIVEREELESQRKAIEADGIRKFQETIAPAISDSYLKWRGIEASLELAKSPNSKIVIFGNSESGLPVIFDATDKTAPAGGPAGIDDPASAVSTGPDKTSPNKAGVQTQQPASSSTTPNMPPIPGPMRGYKDDGPGHRYPAAHSQQR